MSTRAVDRCPPFAWDAEWYVRRYPDIAEAIAQGRLDGPLIHDLHFGYREGRFPSAAEEALVPNSYRVRHLADNGLGYAYDLSPDQHPAGCYEIELVVEKIEPPPWRLP